MCSHICNNKGAARMPRDTRSALLALAETAARNRGFDGFSYADLANGVGIRKASVHHHFPTKADLSTEMMRHYSEKLEQTLHEVAGNAPNAAARLSALVGIYRDALGKGDSLCLCVSLAAVRDNLTDAAIAEMAAFRVMMKTWIAECFAVALSDRSIQDVGDPNEEAASVLAQLEGAQIAARVAKDIAYFDAALALFLRRLPD